MTQISNGDNLDATIVDNNFDTIASEINGNLNDANVKTGADINHGKILGGVRLSNRQNNVTNTTVSSQRICMGWGYWVGDATNSSFNDTVTFPITYSDKPIVLISLLGGAATATPTDQGDFSDWNSQIAASNFLIVSAQSTGVTSFVANLRFTTGSAAAFTSSESIGYSWIAIGTLTN